MDLNIEPPRRAARQTMRSNVPGSPSEYFKRTYCIGILDQLILVLNNRFGPIENQIIKSLMCLAPEFIMNHKVEETLAELRPVVNHFSEVRFLLHLTFLYPSTGIYIFPKSLNYISLPNCYDNHLKFLFYKPKN